MSNDINMTPNRPYLARAIYEWIIDNNLTPHIMVDATQDNVMVPQQFVQNGQIVLNIAPHATHQFEMTNHTITFSARFGGVSHNLYIPMPALLGIYARENGMGLFFDPSEYQDVEFTNEEIQQTKQAPKRNSKLSFVD